MLGFAVLLGLAASPVFERVQLREAHTGLVRLRTVEAPLIEVPDLRSEPPRWTEERFPRLYALEFALEIRRRDHPPVVERRGTLLLAVRASPDDLVLLDDRIRTGLGSLEPDAFVAPLAGWSEERPPLDKLAFLSSAAASWTCVLRADGAPAKATAYLRRGENMGSSGFSRGETMERVCAAMAAAATGAAEEIRTLPGPRELHETAVSTEMVNGLPEERALQDLPSLPGGASWSKRQKEGEGSSVARRDDGTIPSATFLSSGIEWEARSAAAAISPELLVGGAYVARWTLREKDRVLGIEPREMVEGPASLTIALVPVAPPAPPEGSPPGPRLVPIRFDERAFQGEVSRRLDARAVVDAATMESALTEEPAGLGPEGMLMLVCRSDGTAWFGLPPTRTHSPVTNAPLLCAAMDRMLP